MNDSTARNLTRFKYAATLLGAMESAGKQIDLEELRAAMKDSGLGTPATRAAIIETLLRLRDAADDPATAMIAWRRADSEGCTTARRRSCAPALNASAIVNAMTAELRINP